jgi:hypothetical protein
VPPIWILDTELGVEHERKKLFEASQRLGVSGPRGASTDKFGTDWKVKTGDTVLVESDSLETGQLCHHRGDRGKDK